MLYIKLTENQIIEVEGTKGSKLEMCILNAKLLSKNLKTGVSLRHDDGEYLITEDGVIIINGREYDKKWNIG
jgi:hypothetical protein